MGKKNIKQSVVSRNMGIASGLIVICVALLFTLVAVMNSASQAASIVRWNLSENARIFIEGSKTLTNEVRAYASTGDKVHYDNYWREADVDKNREKGVAAMQSIGITSEEQAIIDRMAALSNQLVPLEDQAMKLAEEGRTAEAIDYVYGEDYSKTLDQIYELADTFLVSLDQRSVATLDKLALASKIAMVLTGLSIIALIILQVQNVRFVRNSLIAPILAVKDEMREISKGNLSAEFTLEVDESEVGELSGSIHDSKDTLKTYIADISDKLSEMARGNMDLVMDTEYIGEFKSIGDSMKIILDYMNRTISELKEKTESVANGVSDRAAMVAEVAQRMAGGVQEQSDSVESLLESVNSLTADMDDVVTRALGTEDKANKLSDSLKGNTRQMKDMEKAMQDIAASSEGIKSIINAISNIASQTNLLALNASIEAARAGEAGKGFAVVADEVRVLSEECREASVKTNELIEQSLTAVNRGVELTSMTFASIDGMMTSVSETSQEVGEIAESCKDKVDVLHEIKDMFALLSKGVRSTADTARESSEAADELNGHAEQLSTLFDEFSLQH